MIGQKSSTSQLNIWYVSWNISRSWWILISNSCYLCDVWNVSWITILDSSFHSNSWKVRSWIQMAKRNSRNYSGSLFNRGMWKYHNNFRWRMGSNISCLQIFSWILCSIRILHKRKVQWGLWLSNHKSFWVQLRRHMYNSFYWFLQSFRQRSLWLCIYERERRNTINRWLFFRWDTMIDV